MKTLRAALLRLAGALRLTRRNAEIDEELRSHLDMLVQEHQRRGLSEREARQAAAAEFGSFTSAAEAYRDRRGLPALEHWIRDCRYAARSLAQTRILSASMIVVLALGIGLTTTLATLVHAVMFRALPLPEPERVVKLALRLGGEFDRRVNGHVSQFSYPELELYQSATRALSGVAGVRSERATWVRNGERRALAVALVTANYFNVLQVRASSGRLLTNTDGKQPVAVISHRLWTDMFGQDPAVLGASVLIDRVDYTVVGVAERSFAGTEIDVVDAWVPLDFAAPVRGHGARVADASLSWLQVVGRLAPDATLKSAAAEAGVIAARYDAMHPGQRTTVFVTEAAALDAGLETGDEGQVIAVAVVVTLLGSVVLLICTSNAAGLLLARGVARQRELALRMALGAGRWRIVHQLLTESLLIGVSAAVLGLGLCTVVLRVTAHALPLPDYFARFVPDVAVVSFALLSALAAALLFGVVPAVQATRIDPLPVLKQDAVGLGVRLPATRLRHWLVAGQVAVSLVLLVVAALLGRGVERALRVDSGFPLSGLYAIVVDVPVGESSATDRANLLRRLSLALRSSPGLEVGLAVVGPFAGSGFTNARTTGMSAALPVRFNGIDPGYFRTLGVSNVAGRSFEPGDDRASVIVNARLARTLWGNERAAIGQTLIIPEDRPSSASGAVGLAVPENRSGFRSATVVGVVPTLQSTDVGLPDGPTFYVPIADDTLGEASFLVRSSARHPLQRLVEAATRGSDALAAVASIEERLVSQTGPMRIAAAATVLVGLLTLLVAGAGIYGIVAHSVASRTHEIGVHVALGAPRARVLRLVLGSSLRAIANGAAAGLVIMLIAAAVASKLLESILFGIRALDPLAILGAAVFLATATGLAAYLPARRALDVRPIDALRRI
jgi:predicted permease